MLPVVSLVMGCAFIALALPLIWRKVPPNHWYGLRVPATFADERVWYEANARAGKELLALGVLIIALGAFLYFVTIPFWISLSVWFVFIMGGSIAFAVRGWRFANRLLEVYKSETGRTPSNKPL
ncbi:MAG: SdpI family protein [Ardenticatenia bacterium]|nr:SdpI family protein [Ardenticatenia bacterium]